MGLPDSFALGGERKEKEEPTLTTNFQLKEQAEWQRHLQR